LENKLNAAGSNLCCNSLWGLGGEVEALGWELEEVEEPEWPGLTMELTWKWLKNEVLQ